MQDGNNPKRHHFVPKMLQKHFLNDSEGLWTFDSRHPKRGVWAGQTDGLLLEGHLYSHINSDGSKDLELETWFSRLESHAAPIVEKIIARAAKQQVPELTTEERKTWDVFMYQQFRRVPDFYGSLLTTEEYQRQVQQFLTEFHAKVRPVTNRERSDLLDPVAMKRSYRNLRVSTLKTGSENVLDIMAGRGLAVVRIPNPNKSFVLGSRPVIKLTHPDTSALGDERVELWLAISADIMVGLGPIGRRELIVGISDRNIRFINEGVAAQSSQIVGRSRHLIGSLQDFVGRKFAPPVYHPPGPPASV